MKNALIKLVSLMVLSIMIPTIFIIECVIEERIGKEEEEKRMEQQRMLNEIQPSVEDYEELERLHEQKKIEWEEKVKYEVKNNPNFEEDFNKMIEIEGEYIEMASDIRATGHKTSAERRRCEGNYIENKLNEIELEEGSILDTLRTLMILKYKWDSYGMNEESDLEEIIRHNLYEYNEN